MRRIVILLATLGLIACGGDASTAPNASLNPTGTWRGTSNGYTLSLTLVQTGSTVTGSGQLTGSIGSLAITTSGTFVAPNVSLTLNTQGYLPMNYAGPMANGSTINGTLNGSGFTNVTIPLSKQ